MIKAKLITVAIVFFTALSSLSTAQNLNSEWSIKQYWATNGMDRYEGIYESSGGTYNDRKVPCKNNYGRIICYGTVRVYNPKYKLAMVKVSGNYRLIYLSSTVKNTKKVGGCKCYGETSWSPPGTPWRLGEVKAYLNKTATQGFFTSRYYMGDKTINSDAYITFENNAYFTLSLTGRSETMYIKLYPTVDDGVEPNRIGKSSGSGFAISSNGIIVTNHHVVDGAKSIKVRGVKSDFSKTYNAKVLISDKNNDLALIQIDEHDFTSLGTIPYTIKTGLAGVGEDVFVLGYPLRATMGDEIKLTNGIVSSRTGFQGDISSYQVSAPVQPGNSGGPVFDGRGNLIGIINAKHVGAENATYSVKTSYLSNLTDLLPSRPNFQTFNSLKGKTLTQQVQLAKKFIYIIEVE